MKIYPADQFPQCGLEWHCLRAGIATASELDALITPLWKIRTGEGVQSYLAKKLAEKWQGGPMPAFEGSFAMEQGVILESEAKPWYSLEYNTPIQSVGFITTDDGSFGCSPDGLLGDNSGIEIKAPNADTQVKYLLDGELPKIYSAQVFGSMYATGRDSWKFVSYRRNFPALVLTIERDEEIMEKIQEALESFKAAFDSAYKRMEEINGGPSPNELKRVEIKTSKSKQSPKPFISTEPT